MVAKNGAVLCSIPSLFISFGILCIVSISLLFLLYTSHPDHHFYSSSSSSSTYGNQSFINVYVADLPRSLNYGLLDKFWFLTSDSRLGSDADADLRSRLSSSSSSNLDFPPYPENPLIKQYSAEYWILGDLMTPEESRAGSFARRVYDVGEADVVFVPFFATLSAEMQLGTEKGVFRKKVSGNEDYVRQKQVVDLTRSSDAWKRSGGRDHVFVLTDPVAMWHVRAEIAPAILLVVDFGGWYRLDLKASNGNASDIIQHTQVSLIKDVIVPYTHLLPRLYILEDHDRKTLLYFKGAKHRHRDRESVEHIFFTCAYAKHIWNFWYGFLGGKLRQPSNYVEGLSPSHMSKSPKQIKEVGLITSYATMWSLWLERNKRVFRNMEQAEENL